MTYTTTLTVEECFTKCRNYRYAILDNNSGSPSGYRCGCLNQPGTYFPPQQCLNTARYIYTHPADAAASGLTRRKARALASEEAQRALLNPLCPQGQTACQVGGVSGNIEYECIDTTSELGK